MKNQDILKRLESFALGKGFYIALLLCVAVIGISGYYLYDTMSGTLEPPTPVGGDAVVELPEPRPPRPLPVRPAPAREPKPQPEPPEPQPERETLQDIQPREEPVTYTWPSAGEVLREFSVETLSPDPTMGDWRTHRGLDVAAMEGAQVLSIGPGRVSEVYNDGLMGTTVVVEHPDGVTAVYCGLAEDLSVAEGDRVETGTALGTAGSTAIAESGLPAHIHLETWLAGEPVDPLNYLPLR